MFTFPFSPLPAGTERFKNWGESDIAYDSGDRQGLSPWIKPLYDYVMPLNNYNEIKQSSLWAFVDLVKQTTSPFLMKDPYDYRVNSVMGVRSGIISAATLFMFDTNSYMVRADTTSIGSLFSTLSGYVRNGFEFNYDQDSGLLTVNSKTITDVWGVRSMTYYKKVKFTTPFKETSKMWNVFAGNVTMSEMP
jgi:hypothetical protein